MNMNGRMWTYFSVACLLLFICSVPKLGAQQTIDDPNPYVNETGDSMTGSLDLPQLVVKGKPSFQASGAVSIQPGNPVITGIGTKFLSELTVGDDISLQATCSSRIGEIQITFSTQVQSIESDTSLTATSSPWGIPCVVSSMEVYSQTLTAKDIFGNSALHVSGLGEVSLNKLKLGPGFSINGPSTGANFAVAANNDPQDPHININAGVPCKYVNGNAVGGGLFRFQDTSGVYIGGPNLPGCGSADAGALLQIVAGGRAIFADAVGSDCTYLFACAGMWVNSWYGRDIAVFTSGFHVPMARIDNTGKGFFNGGTQTGGADFAESLTVLGKRDQYEPGDVLVIDPTGNRRMALAQEAYSPLVAGIYSTKPGVLGTPHAMDDDLLKEEVPMAIVGIVPTKASAENGPIYRGDLLVTASTPGHVMKGTDRDRMLGAVVGKALEPLEEGRGMIEVLVTLQ